ncbi:MAG: hypothetical protein MJZ37_07440 [Bacilli bacterium]|nr:hypothetical protein [Bacilli bacterium]
MNDEKIYEMIMKLSRETAEKDARTEARLDDFGKKVDKLEKNQEQIQEKLHEQYEEMKDTLRQTQSVLKRFDEKLDNDWEHFQKIEENVRLQQQDCNERTKQLEEKIKVIQDAPKELLWKGALKVLATLGVMIATGIAAYIYGKIGGK